MTDEEPEYRPNSGFIPVGENPAEQLQEHAEDHPFIADLGVTVESYHDGVLRMSVPHKDKFANPGMEGALHGGVVTSILDTAMGFTLVAAVADDPAVNSGPTVNLNVNFLEAATGDMETVGEVVRIGSSTAVVEGTLRDPATEEAIATAEGVWRVYDSRE